MVTITHTATLDVVGEGGELFLDEGDFLVLEISRNALNHLEILVPGGESFTVNAADLKQVVEALVP